MTQREQDALICLHQRLYNPLSRMSQCIVDELRFARRSYPGTLVETAETYRFVLEQMIVRGWVKVVRETRQRRRERWSAAGWLLPESEDLPEKGDLDFTVLGWKLYRDMQAVTDHLVWLDEREQTFNCVASSKRECRAWLEQRRNPLGGGFLSQWTTYPAQPTVIAEPVRVGKWFAREQQRHQGGWKLTIHFRRVRRRRVQIPELGVTGWLEPREHIVVEGKASGCSFCLYLMPQQHAEGKYLYTPHLYYVGEENEERGWRSPDALSEPMTEAQALVFLREGIEAVRTDRTVVRR